MANFKDYALQYVLTDEQAKMKSVVSKAAADIEESRASSPVLGLWVQSIQTWIDPRSRADDLVDDKEEAESMGNILARSKAIDFLASTLEVLDESTLRPDQVKMLAGFFGSLFNADHRAGITPATKALRRLICMKSFKPSLGPEIIDNLTKLGEEFRRQAPLTRLEVYILLKDLVEDEAVNSELQFKNGATSGFITDLLQMCGNERDPKNLMMWFDILTSFLRDYSPSPEASHEVFKTFSSYFPISLRASATPTGITAEDLKITLRMCFSAHYRISEHVFPYLIQKLDQGDAITVSVKVDILQTLEDCLAKYTHVEKSIAPSAERIWNSLKYEVRNGEVEESIQGTLKALRTLAARLDGDSLKTFTQLVLRDCLEDLTNPTYTSPCGKLLGGVYTASPAAFAIVVQTLIPHVKMCLRQSKSAAHKHDLVGILNSVLSARMQHVTQEDNRAEYGVDQIELTSPVVTSVFEDVYLALWKENITGTDATSLKANVLKQVVKGLALIVEQEKVGGQILPWTLLCTETTCSKVSQLLSQIILESPLAAFSEEKQFEIEDEAVKSLQKIATAYAAGFVSLVASAKAKFKETNDPHTLELLTSRLAFIGCSKPPRRVGDFHNFTCLVGALLGEIHDALHNGSRQVGAILVAAIHCAILAFHGSLPSEESSGALLHLGAGWADEVAASYPSLPQVDLGQLGDWQIAGTTPGNWSDNRAELSKISLFVVRQLYRRVTVVSDREKALALDSDISANSEFLSYLAAMTTFVVRELSAESQQALSLYQETVCLFRGDDEISGTLVKDHFQTKGYRIGGRFDLLGLLQGILQGLWPTSLSEMCGNGMGLSLAKQLLESGPGSEIPQQKSANSIVCILANKYNRKAEDWPALVAVFTDKVSSIITNTDSSNLGSQLRLLQTCVAFAAGALLNYDKQVSQLVGKLVEIPSHPTIGLYAAREFSHILSPREALTPANHAASKLLGKQWAYTQLAKPMFEKAAPFSKEVPEGHNYAVATMDILKHLPFALYEDDGDSVVRIALPALSTLGVGPDVEAALNILLQFVEHKPDVLKQRLNAVIKGSLDLVNEAKGGKKETREDDVSGVATKVNPPVYRKLALILIACLPLKFEERHLLSHAPKLQRTLAFSCGDPVREVRQAALRARVSWSSIN
ncbi:hypothetical protein MKZ38_003119 [Zalerion maritima]|uniref:MMS19 nucleotide excision repair protein n=1 Tax=Zalerion maritima TaxID=339359 RepID=A0AAD5RWZ6_9PEZI|nr:hypothetical protein MKZ38_003119 [Zalerion maritima]